MSSVNYSLKNGINRINNPTIGGVFSYGSYTSAGVFTLFTDYEYSDGTPFVSEPFDTAKPLVWKGVSEYPHIGFENLTPNSAITPQPFPSFGIYLHPYIIEGVRQDVGIRVTIPFGGNLSISSIIQRADLECGDDIGYRIMRNGVAIQSRRFIQSSNTPTIINTPASTFVAGDIIDFIVDIGSQSNSFCDDVTLEVTLNYQYTQIPEPIVTTNPILCSTTEINGTTAYVSEGTFASIYDGTTLLYSTAVVLDPVLLNGTFSFTDLDFTNSFAKTICIVLEKSGDVPSNPIKFTIQDGGCLEIGTNKPIITGIDFCNKKCYNGRTMSGTSNNEGDIVIFEYPYNYGDEIIATTTSNGTWSAISDRFVEKKRYVAFLLNYNNTLDTDVTIDSLGCDADCVYMSTLNGTVNGINNGVLRAFDTPYTGVPLPVLTGIIKDGSFSIKNNTLSPNTEYIFMAVKIN